MALGSGTFSSFAGAASDLFASKGYSAKAKGDVFEQQNYQLAAKLAKQNEAYTVESTAIKQAQLDRQIYQTIGGQQADVAGAGFAASGSALDLMRDSAAQGALTKEVLAKQGVITEAGYAEQAQSYENMSKAAQVAINAENEAAKGSEITGILKAAAGVASLFTGLPISSVVDGFTPEAPKDPSNPLVINQYGSPGPVNNNPLGGLY
jgi:hypothetical protein